MQNLQDVWNRIETKKQEQKRITAAYKDALENLHEYREVVEKIKALIVRKKQLEFEAKNDLGSEYDKLNALKKDAKLDKELLSDIALSTLMKGETVKISDEEQNLYEPIFSVRFKKANEVERPRE